MPLPKNLILCVHAHQPVGNFNHVFLDAYEKSYRPFFEVLEKHPSIKMNCHFSGSLIDWIEKNKSEFFDRLKILSARGQIEFLAGAYYEPIYGVIPARDLIGQIRMMRAKLQALFGVSARGGWLTERVWDTAVAKPMRQAGLEYTILDDFHFEKIGMKAPVTGYYQTKNGRAVLDLFASMKELRYLVPFRKPEETINFIQGCTGGPSDAFVFADDCEKFGFWPGTYSWVYTEGWLDRFFTLLEENKDIRLYTFGEFRGQFRPKGAVRVPHASYSEMMEWSGGKFYNFFKKYPESQYLRDRMRALSDRLQKAVSKNGTSDKIKNAVQALYRAQCNCAYWHGVFGGLYLHHLRSAVFENLIQADRLLSDYAAASGKGARLLQAPSIRQEILASGPRWTVRQKNMTLRFNPQYGGALEELDFIPKSANLICTLMRRKEVYHEAVLKAGGAAAPDENQPLSIHQILGAKELHLEDHLFYDPCRRLSLMDHFFEHEISQEDFLKAVYSEAGDFIGSRYKAGIRKKDAVQGLRLERKGTVLLAGKKRFLRVAKTVLPKKESAFTVIYTLQNESATPIELAWGVEFNFSIGDPLASRGLSETAVKNWIFKDEWRGIQIRISLGNGGPWRLLAAPVETVSESESGLERTFQGLGVLFQKQVALKGKEAREYRLEVACS